MATPRHPPLLSRGDPMINYQLQKASIKVLIKFKHFLTFLETTLENQQSSLFSEKLTFLVILKSKLFMETSLEKVVIQQTQQNPLSQSLVDFRFQEPAAHTKSNLFILKSCQKQGLVQVPLQLWTLNCFSLTYCCSQISFLRIFCAN